jgi:hypothetical protein
MGSALVNYNIAAMNRELAKAGDNEAAKDEIKRKYAKKNQQIASAQARIDGALAIMGIWAGTITSNPVLDAILKGILTAAVIIETESQVSLIKSQGFAKGGLTHGAQTYIAGEKGQEWIAPNWMLEHPYLSPVIRDLESIRSGRSPESVFRSPVTPEYNSTSTNNNSSGGTSFQSSTMNDTKLNRMIEQNNELIKFFKDPENRKTYIKYDDLTKYSKDIQNMQELSGF